MTVGALKVIFGEAVQEWIAGPVDGKMMKDVLVEYPQLYQTFLAEPLLNHPLGISVARSPGQSSQPVKLARSNNPQKGATLGLGIVNYMAA